jgi:hypothetical protein
LVFQRWLLCRQKPNVLFVRLAFTLSDNVLQIGEVADLEALTFNLALKFI